MKSVLLALAVGFAGAAFASDSNSTHFEVRGERQRITIGGNIPVIAGQPVFLDEPGTVRCETKRCTITVLAFLIKGDVECFALDPMVDGVVIQPTASQCGTTGTAFQSLFVVRHGTHSVQTQFELDARESPDTISSYQIAYTIYDH
jgi:hypothetical protein